MYIQSPAAPARFFERFKLEELIPHDTESPLHFAAIFKSKEPGSYSRAF